jgi:hypothetical protein
MKRNIFHYKTLVAIFFFNTPLDHKNGNHCHVGVMLSITPRCGYGVGLEGGQYIYIYI